MLYATFFPCIACALAIIQSGITRVVAWDLAEGDEHWKASIEKSMAVFDEASLEWEMRPRPSGVPSSAPMNC
jgi:deoxycytidylate deaminase